jgi:hypothetical protein
VRLFRRSQPAASVSPELEAEITAHPAWMYPWRLRNGRDVPLLGPELPSIHASRSAMVEPFVRRALAEAGPDATAIDLGASEGWFAHRMLEWGAKHVVAVDVREGNLRRAALLRDHYGIPEDRITLHHASVHELDAEALGTFDVVLCFGLIYHLENPIGALRTARELARGLCAVETQAAVTGEARYTWGTTGEYLTTPAAWATRVEPALDQESNPIASYGGIVSLVPNAAALVESLETVGFGDVQLVPATPDANPQYQAADRLVAVGWAR